VRFTGEALVESTASSELAPADEEDQCRVNMANVKQSRPHSRLGFQARVLDFFAGVLSSQGSGSALAVIERAALSGLAPANKEGRCRANMAKIRQSR